MAPLLVFVLLFAMFGNVKDGLLVFRHPLRPDGRNHRALATGHTAIDLGGGWLHRAIGCSRTQRLVMISFIRSLRDEGTALDAAIAGALTRLRPVLMTALVASLGFIPWQLPQAPAPKSNVRWLRSSSAGFCPPHCLTLLVLPLLYRMAHRPDERNEDAGAVEHPLNNLAAKLTDVRDLPNTCPSANSKE